jgi:2',3'-cyclic-nucleotide 2'-phosphodiesterase (5'-nucleotidase family)
MSSPRLRLCRWLLALAIVSSTFLPAQSLRLTILHTNDMHAQFIPHEAAWIRDNPKPMVGGFIRLSELIDSIRSARPATLVLDAGDVMTGNPVTDITYMSAEGGALFEMMNMMGYDAWSPGNHDFDISQDNLRALVKVAKFPTLSANLVNDRGEFPVGNKPYAVFERGGLSIGVIGIISPELYGLVNQNNLVGIRVLSPVETVRKYVDELRPKTDLLILLTHEGVDFDSSLAMNVSGIDLIVGGHSHTRLKGPKIVHGIPIVQTGANTESLGLVDITVDNGKVVNLYGKLISTWPSASPRKNSLSALADSMERLIDKDYSEVIGTLSMDWKRSEGQTAIGTFIAEAQREAAAAEVAFTNNHGIRKDLSAGPITKRALFEILPFRNILTTFQLRGKQLFQVMKYNLEQRPAIQIAGMTATYARIPGGGVDIKGMEVNGRPLDMEKMYICAASDYFVGEAKHYIGLEIQQPYYLTQTVFSAVEKAIRRAKTIEPKVLYSIQEIH